MTQVIHTRYFYDKIFRVEVTGNEVSIFKHCWECLEPGVNDFVIKLDYHLCVYLSYDTIHENDPFYMGNSVIVRVDKRLHIFIGEEVYAFYLDEPIINFNSYSIKGQSFPYILTPSGYYLLFDKLFLPREKNIEDINPYELYHLHKKEGFKEYTFFEMCSNYLLK